jgi:tripartite ATP-independent transporter DctM subunit
MIPLTYLWVFLAAMAIGVPIVFALVIAPIAAFILADKAMFLQVLPQKILFGINQFPLLAIPLFILAGEIMNTGGITERLVRLANALVGHFRGGLAQVNVVSSIFFAGLSGSAVADTSALGAMLIPAMEKEGYTRRFAAAVTAASSVIGPIIPPSIIMVVYAYIMQVSVAALFLAGFVPGVLTGIGLMIMTNVIARKRNYPRHERRGSVGELLTAARGAFLPMLTPVIILGGILAGVFTPTEAAAAAVLYALFLSVLVLRTLKLTDLPPLLLRTGVAASAILLAIGMAATFGWVATLSGVPNRLAEAIFAISDNPYVLLFLINVLLLVVGMFLDAGPAILILGPILVPTMLQLGLDQVHVAIIMCVNLTIGLATPPMGLILFVASTISGERIEAIAKEMLPYFVVHLTIIFLITYFPALSLTLPRLFGFVG